MLPTVLSLLSIAKDTLNITESSTRSLLSHIPFVSYAIAAVKQDSTPTSRIYIMLALPEKDTADILYALRRLLIEEHRLSSPSHPPLSNCIAAEPVLDSPPVCFPCLIPVECSTSHRHQVQHGPDTADDEARWEAIELGAYEDEFSDACRTS